MPKIRSFTYIGFSADITYSVKNSRFEILLSDKDFAEWAKTDKIIGKSEDEVSSQFQQLATKYKKEGLKREKYIAVHIESEDNCNDSFYRADGQTSLLKIQWCLVDRIVVQGDEVYKSRPKQTGLLGHDERFYEHNEGYYQFIPWTAKREAFLRQMADSLKELAAMVHKFFAAPDLVAKIDTQKILLLTTK